jgi:hypothetical protein
MGKALSHGEHRAQKYACECPGLPLSVLLSKAAKQSTFRGLPPRERLAALTAFEKGMAQPGSFGRRSASAASTGMSRLPPIFTSGNLPDLINA